MKRLLAVLGVFALLGTLFVLANASPASADPVSIPLSNEGIQAVSVTASGCGYTGETAVGPVLVPPGKDTASITLDDDCESWTVTGRGCTRRDDSWCLHLVRH